ncbi:hypothetical protein ZOSMA_197G00090 [Zostera marina]|uniref:Retrotransposon gag domain-containing protein n=1 Tax=Zostera marina TaxID=29655 RepID=A0A0K9PNU9_ZOSMR|nr:hypothetical protein ZOSMA_197G00090 [Zostera marina]
MAEASDPYIRRSELKAFQDNMLRKMSELMKEQHTEVRTLIAIVNASVLTGSQTPPPYNPTTTGIPPSHFFPSNRPPTFQSTFQPTLQQTFQATPHQRPPGPPTWEDGSSDKEFPLKRPASQRSNVGTHLSSRLKADIPMFYGLTNNETFVDWVADVDEYFAYVPVDENSTAQLVALRLKGCAKAWWRQTQSSRANRRKGPILVWRKMKALMYERFLPANYSEHCLRNI